MPATAPRAAHAPALPEEESALLRTAFSALGGKGGSKYRLVRNPDGSIRWIFPAGLRRPTFLSLYNANTLKARVRKAGIGLLFRAGLQGAAFPESIEAELDGGIRSVLEACGARSFSIFTGTKGRDRKFLIEANDGARTRFFLKIPCGEGAADLIRNEHAALRTLGASQWRYFQAPEAAYHPECKALRLSNIAGRQQGSPPELGPAHFRALGEIYARFGAQAPAEEVLSEVPLPAAADTRNGVPPDLAARVIGSLARLRARLAARGTPVPVALSHGDFTPWNMYGEGGKLRIYDWEMASFRRPILFDLFHFRLQTGVLVHRLPYREIRSGLGALFAGGQARELAERHGAEPAWSYGAYLLRTVSFYLERYMTQHDLHAQALWLIRTWNDALEDYLGSDAPLR